MEEKDGFRIGYSGKERKFVSETDVKHLSHQIAGAGISVKA